MSPHDPPRGFLDLRNGELAGMGTAADFAAAADWLERNYPDVPQREPRPFTGVIWNMVARWFNSAAVEWVFYEAPADLSPGLALTLAVVASFAGRDGRAAYPSAAMVAMLTRKSEKQARRDLHELVKRKLLVKGDRRAVVRLRADRRPDVYDLPENAREYIGKHRRRNVPRLDTDGESSMSTRDGNDWTSGASTTGHLRPDDSPWMSTEEIYEEISENGAPPARVAGAGDGTPETQTPAPPGDREPVDVGAEIARAKARLAALNGRPADVPLTGVPVGGTPVPPAETPDGHAVGAEHRQRELDRLAAWMAEHPEAAAQ